MTLCPIALAVGCRKCLAFQMCPLKGVVGDYVEEARPPPGGERREGPKDDETPR
jgi:hypothetical protein